MLAGMSSVSVLNHMQPRIHQPLDIPPHSAHSVYCPGPAASFWNLDNAADVVSPRPRRRDDSGRSQWQPQAVAHVHSARDVRTVHLIQGVPRLRRRAGVADRVAVCGVVVRPASGSPSGPARPGRLLEEEPSIKRVRSIDNDVLVDRETCGKVVDVDRGLTTRSACDGDGYAAHPS
jgi:hypothetical protein